MDAVTAQSINIINLAREIFFTKNRKVKSQVQLEEIKGALLRALESHPDNPALDLCYALHESFISKTGVNLSDEAENRLIRFIGRLKESLHPQEFFEQMKDLYELASKLKTSKFGGIMLETIGEQNFASWVYEKYGDDTALTLLVQKMNNDLESVL